MTPRRNVVVYGHLNLNIIDGSATWLTSLVETLTMTNSTVHLLLRVPIQTNRLLERIENLPHVVVHPGLVDGWTGMLTASQAIGRLEELVTAVDAAALIIRGREFGEAACQSAIISPVLWTYVTDFGFPAPEMTATEFRQMSQIASKSRRLLLQTEETRSYIEALVPEANGKTLLMTPTVPDELFVPLDEKLPSDQLRLIYAGKFHPHWRTLDMIDLPAMLRTAGVPSVLTMLGDKFQVAGEWSAQMRAGLEGTTDVVWGGGVPREQVTAQVARADVGLSWRTSDLDSSLELSTKLLEYAAAGTPPVLNRTRAHEDLLGPDYPLFLDDDSAETLIRVLSEKRQILGEIRAHVQAAAWQYSSSITAERLENYLDRAGSSPEPSAREKALRVAVVHDDLAPDSLLGDVLARCPGVELRAVSRHEAQTAEAMDAESGPPVVLRCSGADRLDALLDEVALESLSAVVVPTSEDAAQVQKSTALEPSKLWVIPSAINTNDLRRPKSPDARFCLGLREFLPFDARPDRALDVLERLVAVDPRFHLYVRSDLPWRSREVWGEPAEQECYREFFQRIREDAVLVNHVTFRMPGPDTASWLRDIGWILSLAERNIRDHSTIEAMASGTVPVLWSQPGLSSTVDPGFVYQDIDSIVDAILLHVSSDARWETASARARHDADRYDISVVSQQWLGLLTSLDKDDLP